MHEQDLIKKIDQDFIDLSQEIIKQEIEKYVLESEGKE